MSLTHVLKRPVRYVRYYGNRPRRALRRTSRYLTALSDPHNYPRGKVVKAYWFDQFPNFGDALTPWLLQEAGYIPQLSRSDEADVSGVGSILEMLHPQYDGAVWGSGLLYGQARPMPRAKWLAVRGQATRDLVGAPTETPLGDPGILVSRFMRRPTGRRELLGVVPHHAQLADPLWQQIRQLRSQSQIIDPVGRRERVVSKIAECSLIITSSLHGLITADAFGIPAVWVVLNDHQLRGGEFKFHDYESAYQSVPGRKVVATSGRQVLEEAQEVGAAPAQEEVDRLQAGLLDALSRLRHRSMSPLRSF